MGNLNSNPTPPSGAISVDDKNSNVSSVTPSDVVASTPLNTTSSTNDVVTKDDSIDFIDNTTNNDINVSFVSDDQNKPMTTSVSQDVSAPVVSANPPATTNPNMNHTAPITNPIADDNTNDLPDVAATVTNSAAGNNGDFTDPAQAMSSMGMKKENEPQMTAETPPMQELPPDMEIAPELEQIGVEQTSETINLPPDIQKMGVQAVGPAQPHPQHPSVILPIADDKVLQGKRSGLMSSLFWLALWCVRQLKKAHLRLTKRKGQVVRIAD